MKGPRKGRGHAFSFFCRGQRSVTAGWTDGHGYATGNSFFHQATASYAGMESGSMYLFDARYVDAKRAITIWAAGSI